MKLPVVWLPEANAELQQSRVWYDNIHADLSDRFTLPVFIAGAIPFVGKLGFRTFGSICMMETLSYRPT
jgi:hypothetical protein